ncbi:MAG: hypothetical protein ACPKNR_00730 [Pleomorphochaeta sp.]
MFGFYIKELMLIGEGKKDVSIILEKGLNVISGPSNTGKTFIFECIDYIFGKKSIKTIPEIKGYEYILLEIIKYSDNQSLTIKRSFIDLSYCVYYESSISNIDQNSEEFKLKTMHDADSVNNISKFFLKAIGILDNKFLITSKKKIKPRSLSYRDICHLCLISETDIVSEKKTPILTGQNTQKTVEESVFRYFLTGEDDKDFYKINCEEIKTINNAKIEYIKSDLSSLVKQRDNLKEQIEKNEFNDLHFDEYNKQIEKIEKIIKEKKSNLDLINKKNNQLKLKKHKTQLILNKFQLLKKQYLSDLERLEFTDFGSNLFLGIDISHCPLCDSDLSNIKNDLDKSEIEKYYHDEKNDITINLSELELSIKDLNQRLQEIDDDLIVEEKAAMDLMKEINLISSKDLIPLKQLLNKIIENEKVKARFFELDYIIKRKDKELLKFKKSPELLDEAYFKVDEEIYKELCNEIKISLDKCGYETQDVFFDQKIQDIVIDGNSRLSNGKGYRAFIYSIFSASLMQYMKKKERDFSKLLILDSPLTTLKESNIHVNESLPESLQDCFFKFFASSFEDFQVVIIDNKTPSNKIKYKINNIIFTKDKNKGRYGFI